MKAHERLTHGSYLRRGCAGHRQTQDTDSRVNPVERPDNDGTVQVGECCVDAGLRRTESNSVPTTLVCSLCPQCHRLSSFSLSLRPSAHQQCSHGSRQRSLTHSNSTTHTANGIDTLPRIMILIFFPASQADINL